MKSKSGTIHESETAQEKHLLKHEQFSDNHLSSTLPNWGRRVVVALITIIYRCHCRCGYFVIFATFFLLLLTVTVVPRYTLQIRSRCLDLYQTGLIQIRT